MPPPNLPSQQPSPQPSQQNQSPYTASVLQSLNNNSAVDQKIGAGLDRLLNKIGQMLQQMSSFIFNVFVQFQCKKIIGLVTDKMKELEINPGSSIKSVLNEITDSTKSFFKQCKTNSDAYFSTEISKQINTLSSDAKNRVNQVLKHSNEDTESVIKDLNRIINKELNSK